MGTAVAHTGRARRPVAIGEQPCAVAQQQGKEGWPMRRLDPGPVLPSILLIAAGCGGASPTEDPGGSSVCLGTPAGCVAQRGSESLLHTERASTRIAARSRTLSSTGYTVEARHTAPSTLLLLTAARSSQGPAALVPPSSEVGAGDIVLAASTDQLPKIIKQLVAAGASATKTFSGVSTAVGIAEKALQFIGVLEDDAAATKSDLAALSDQLNQLAGAITWGITEEARERIYGNVVGDLLSVQDAFNLHQTPIAVSSALAVDSQNSVIQAEQPIFYQRLFLEHANDGEPIRNNDFGSISWKGVIRDRPATSNGWVYDWRLGVPWMVRLVAMRLPVIAAEDPNFPFDGAFNADLEQYAQALSDQEQQMIDGIRCNTLRLDVLEDPFIMPQASDFFVACADIYSGLSKIFQAGIRGWPVNTAICYPDNSPDQACLAQANAEFQAWYQRNVAPLPSQAYDDVIAQLPIADMDTMIEQLFYPTE